MKTESSEIWHDLKPDRVEGVTDAPRDLQRLMASVRPGDRYTITLLDGTRIESVRLLDADYGRLYWLSEHESNWTSIGRISKIQKVKP